MLAEQIDKQVKAKQKQLPINDILTTSVSNLEVSIDAISNDASSSAFPRLRQTLQSLSQNLASIYSKEFSEKGNSEHSTTRDNLPAHQSCFSSPGVANQPATDSATVLCSKLINTVIPPESLDWIESKLNASKTRSNENLLMTNDGSFKSPNLIGSNCGSDVIMLACHWLVCATLCTTNQKSNGKISENQQSNSANGKRDGQTKPINWSQAYSILADLEGELDKKVESHLEVVEAFAELIPGYFFF